MWQTVYFFIAGQNKKSVTRPNASDSSISYQIVNHNNYQNFIVNWDNEKQPVFYALIENSEQYNQVFHPAPVMGTNKPFAPSPQTFQSQDILLAARVTAPLTEVEQSTVFKVESITARNNELSFHYQFNEPTKATSTSKEYLGVLIPKGDYQKISIFENGKLEPPKGIWVSK